MKNIILLFVLLHPAFAFSQWTLGERNFTPASATPQAATPSFSPAAGAVYNPTTVTASTATSGCGGYIYFDTNNPPTTQQTTFSVTTAETLYAQVIGCPSYADSNIASAAYTIAPPLPTYSTSGVNAAFGSGTCTQYSACSQVLTVSATDLVVVGCGTVNGTGSLSSYTASSSPAETFNAGTFTNNSGNTSAVQMNWGIMANTGSHTFTCTPSPASQYNYIVVYVYSGGSGATLNVQQVNNSTSGTIQSSGPYTTTAPTISFLCTSAGNVGQAVGTINGNTALHFYSTPGSPGGWFGCEVYSSSTSFSGGTAIVLTTSSTTGVAAVVAIQ